MPYLKRRLTKNEKAAYLAYVKELRGLGIDLEVPEEEAPPVLAIEIASPPASMMYVLPCGMVVYDILARMVSLLSGLVLMDCLVGTAWDTQAVLESFENQRGPVWTVGDIDYSRDEVLNQRLDNYLRFHRAGDMVEGRILATSFRPIPAEYRNGAIVPFHLTFLDQFDHELTEQGYIQVSRSTVEEKVAYRPHRGLYEPKESRELVENTIRPPAADYGVILPQTLASDREDGEEVVE